MAHHYVGRAYDLAFERCGTSRCGQSTAPVKAALNTEGLDVSFLGQSPFHEEESSRQTANVLLWLKKPASLTVYGTEHTFPWFAKFLK